MIPLIRDSQIALFAVAIVFGTIATAAVCLRLLAARMSSRRLDASDYSILVAWLLTMGLMVTCILGMCWTSCLLPLPRSPKAKSADPFVFRSCIGRIWLALS